MLKDMNLQTACADQRYLIGIFVQTMCQIENLKAINRHI